LRDRVCLGAPVDLGIQFPDRRFQRGEAVDQQPPSLAPGG
jgi:hypothetical protein